MCSPLKFHLAEGSYFYAFFKNSALITDNISSVSSYGKLSVIIIQRNINNDNDNV